MSNELGYIIRDKETKETWVAQSGKRVWVKPAHAKLAFVQSQYHNERDPKLKHLLSIRYESPYRTHYHSIRFDDQDAYEIVALSPEVSDSRGEGEKLLKECLGRLTDSTLENKIKTFLEKGETNE